MSYVYDAAYQVPEGSRTFGTFSGVQLGIPAREPMSLTSRWTVPLGGLRAESAQLGGWTLSPHHMYDFSRRTLLLGNGEQQSADVRNLQQFEMTTAAGMLQCCGDGSGVATRTRLDAPFQIDVGADGSVYLNEWEEIRRVTPDGMIERIAGTGRGGFNGDGPATSSQIDANSSLAIGSDGAIYIPDRGNYRVRRIKNGILTTVAGNGEPPDIAEPVEENVPATQARVNPADVAVAPDGTLYIADTFRYIRRITPDGIIRTIAGGGTERGDGVPARRFRFNNELEGIALAPDGSIYFAEQGPNGANLRRIGPDGTVGTVIESGPHCATGDEPFDGPVATACLEKVWFLRVGPDGSVYIPDQIGSRVRMITPDGVIRTIAGNGVSGSSSQLRPRGVATGEMLGQPFGAAVGPDGTVYATDAVPEVVRRIAPTLARFAAGETVIPASDGSELYVFSGSRHLRTLDALTGAVLLTFAYDADGRLTAITDFDGKVTAVERSGGTISAIVAPGGQRTAISVDTNGYVRTIADPAGQAYTFIHTDSGLLTELRTPRLFSHSYTYDDDGRLQKDLSPDGRSLTLTRSGVGDDWSVTTRTSLGLAMTKDRERLSDGSSRRVSLLPGGLSVETAIGSSGASVVTLPDGLIARSTPKADPRLGTSAPLFSRELVFPSGLTLTSSHTRTVTLSDPDDSLSLTLQADSLNVNGRVTTTTFDALLRQMRITTPAGRTSLVSTDGALRPLVIDTPGLAQTQIGYTDGLVASVSAGNRFVSYQYDAKRRLQSQTDSLNRTVSFEYDDADRVTSQTLPDGRVIAFGYDAAGNLISVTPPSRPVHAMTLTPGDQLASYHAPAIAGAGNITQYVYDLDRKLTAITRPDQSTITVSHDSQGRVTAVTGLDAGVGVTWDSAGRVGTLTSVSGTLTYAYDGSLLTGATMSGEVAGSIAYTYDNSLRMSGESVNNAPVSFGWDNDDLLIQVGTLTLTRRSDNGLLSGTSIGGITDAFTYNELGEVMTYNAAYVGSAMVAATNSRDSVGRITGATETILGVTAVRGYEYDAAGRLERVTSGGATLSTYGYDDNGNRTSHVRSIGTDVGSYDAQDRLIAYGDSTYAFTANGDLQARTLAGATTTYDYDAFGNLTEVVLPGGTTIEYVVDAQNRRVGKKRNGVLEKGWLYGDQLRIVAELAPDGAVLSRFVYGSRPNTPDILIRDGVTYRIITDHLGSPRLVVNTSDGTIAQRIDYDEFGNVLSDTNPGLQPFAFAGGFYDRDTGLVTMGAREYDPHTGRFVTKDPIGFPGGDTNFYAYVMNDPINLIDPTGLYSTLDFVEDAANFSAGFGDSLTFGATDLLREHVFGGNEGVDRCGGAYAWGQRAEIGFEFAAMGGSGALRGLAAGASRKQVYAAAKRATSKFPGAGGSVHHVNPLFGHPGGRKTLFPTGGLPASIHSGSWNLNRLSWPDHLAAHRRLRRAESIGRVAVNPAMTGARLGRNVAGGCGCP